MRVNTIPYVMNHLEDVVYFNNTFYSVTPAYTHKNKFHADDIFATALMFLLYQKQHASMSEKECTQHFQVERATNETANAIVAIGDDGYGVYPLVFDIGNGEYDHHGHDREERPNGIAYAAFGKLWRACYKEFGIDEEHYRIFDQNFVQYIDSNDCHGVRDPLTYFITQLNPMDEQIDAGETTYEVAFENALTMYAIPILRSLMSDLKNRMGWIDRIRGEGGFDYSDLGPEVAGFSSSVLRTWVADYTEAKAMLYPHRRGGYALESLITYDRYGAPINRWLPERRFYDGTLSAEEKREIGLTFAHPAGFLLIFSTKEEAVAFAKEHLCTNT